MATPPATIGLMLGVPVRLHAVDGDDLGIAHIPMPIEPGDLVATIESIYRVVDVMPSPGYAVAALCKVRTERLIVRRTLSPQLRRLRMSVLGKSEVESEKPARACRRGDPRKSRPLAVPMTTSAYAESPSQLRIAADLRGQELAERLAQDQRGT
jgi:hypothetical protein